METIKVNIEYCAGNGFYYATANRGKQWLCWLRKSDYGDVWYFTPREGHSTHINGDEFPLAYFKRLCQALWFVEYGTDEFPEVELTVSAKNQLKIK